jgi:hypothetical protein
MSLFHLFRKTGHEGPVGFISSGVSEFPRAMVRLRTPRNREVICQEQGFKSDTTGRSNAQNRA